jgi:RecJ-like exonuclease
MMESKSIKTMENLLSLAKFGEWTINRLCGVRFAHESDRDTLKRIIKTANKIICHWCHGSGRIYTSKCSKCNGTGEQYYDPMEKFVKEIMNV